MRRDHRPAHAIFAPPALPLSSGRPGSAGVCARERPISEPHAARSSARARRVFSACVSRSGRRPSRLACHAARSRRADSQSRPPPGNVARWPPVARWTQRSGRSVQGRARGGGVEERHVTGLAERAMVTFAGDLDHNVSSRQTHCPPMTLLGHEEDNLLFASPRYRPYSGQEYHAEQHGDRDEEHRCARRGLDQHLAIAEPYLAWIDTQGVVEHRACHVEDQERQQTKCTGDRDVAGRLGPLSPPWPR
jgi:hypothetical protein